MDFHGHSGRTFCIQFPSPFEAWAVVTRGLSGPSIAHFKRWMKTELSRQGFGGHPGFNIFFPVLKLFYYPFLHLHVVLSLFIVLWFSKMFYMHIQYLTCLNISALSGSMLKHMLGLQDVPTFNPQHLQIKTFRWKVMGKATAWNL